MEGVGRPRGITFRRFKPPRGEVGTGDVTVINAQFPQESRDGASLSIGIETTVERRTNSDISIDMRAIILYLRGTHGHVYFNLLDGDPKTAVLSSR